MQSYAAPGIYQDDNGDFVAVVHFFHAPTGSRSTAEYGLFDTAAEAAEVAGHYSRTEKP